MPICQEISHFDDKKQAELIADTYEKKANQYEPLNDDDIVLPNILRGTYPKVSVKTIYKHMSEIKTNKSTVLNDLPGKVIKRFAKYLCYPMCNIINTQIRRGEFPNTLKLEQVTPIPKTYPTLERGQLRKISVFKQFGKISEKIISEMVIEDLKSNLEKAQYGNQKGTSINHYLINLIDKSLITLDKNKHDESYALILNLYDWKKAFDMQ